MRDTSAHYVFINAALPLENTMTTTDLAAEMKQLSLLKTDGATPEIRAEAAQKHAALKARLSEELAKMQSPSYWRR